MCKKPNRSADWRRGFKHLSSVQRYCSNYIASWGSQAIPIDRIWCDVLFMRSVVALKSVLVLIHHDAVDDAAIIVRTLFEIEFQLGAIKSDREIAVRLIQASEAARLKRLKRFNDSGRPLPQGMTEEEIKRQLEQLRSKPPTNYKRYFWLRRLILRTNTAFFTLRFRTPRMSRLLVYVTI